MKKKIWIIISIALITIGFSYALWVQNLYQSDENLMATSCFNITMEQANTIGIQNAYPITDEAGRKLTPYTFIIKNNCEAYASYQVNLEVLNTSTLTNLEFVKVMFDVQAPVILSSKEDVTKTIDNASIAKLLIKGGLDVNESKTHSLRLWIDESVTTEDNIENTKFVAQIGLSAAYTEKQIKGYDLCIEKYGEESIQCQILLAESDKSLCPTVNNDGTVNVTDIEDKNALLCSAPDDYGNSYYFRGVPENDWVKFGGYYWRIIRINGDDSIRMIYAGDASVIDALDETTKVTVLSNGYNDSITKYTQIGTNSYNASWKKDNVLENLSYGSWRDNTGVGYMYGNRNGLVEGSTQYNTFSWASTGTYYISKEYSYNASKDVFSLKEPTPVLASEMNSNCIGYYTLSQKNTPVLNKFVYKITNVSSTDTTTTVGYSYVTYGTTSKEKAQTNTNDSTIKVYLDNWYAANLASYETYINDTLFCNERTVQENVPNSYSNLGYGVERTAYRWYSSSNKKTLNCRNKNDRFTVDDEVIGNGELTNPIGLITMDELNASGVFRGSNTLFYLYTGNWYWTMSPPEFHGYGAYMRYLSEEGTTLYNYSVMDAGGVRPVINLKPNVLKSGDGSASNPYKVEEN